MRRKNLLPVFVIIPLGLLIFLMTTSFLTTLAASLPCMWLWTLWGAPPFRKVETSASLSQKSVPLEDLRSTRSQMKSRPAYHEDSLEEIRSSATPITWPSLQDSGHLALSPLGYRDQAAVEIIRQSVNPATGLPMLDDVVDIHLNMFGTSTFEHN